MANSRKICCTIGFICHTPCPEHTSNIFRFQGEDKYSSSEQLAPKEEYLSSAICRLNFRRSTTLFEDSRKIFSRIFFLQDFYFSGLNFVVGIGRYIILNIDISVNA